MGMFTKKLGEKIQGQSYFAKRIARERVVSMSMAQDMFKDTVTNGIKGLQGALKGDYRYNQPAERSEKQIAALLKAQGISAQKRRKNK